MSRIQRLNRWVLISVRALRRNDAVRSFAVALAVIVAVVAASCDKVPLTSPTGSTVTLTVSSTSIPINGTAQVTAVVIESSGTAVHDGTIVTFVGALGRFSPPEAPTVGGVARTVFTATGSGTVKIGAFSGAAKATEVEVKVGGAAAEKVTVRTEPSAIPQTGGTVTVIAAVTDASGNALPNTPISFTVDQGSLSSSSSTTDANGDARVTLTTNRTTKITASVAGKTAEFTVTALAAPTVAVSGCTAAPSVGVAVICTITPTVSTGGSAIQNLTVSWGDGTGEQPLGGTGTTTASHIYTAPGTYTITAAATDLNSQRGQGAASVVVIRSIPAVSITGPTTGNVGASVSFSVTPPPASANPPTSDVTVDFGDGTTRSLGAITALTAVPKTYGTAGNYTVSATVTDTVGTRNTSTTFISITGSGGPGITLTQGANISGGCTSFTLALTPTAGTTIQSGYVRLTRTGADLYTGTSSTTFTACGLVVNDTVTARYTDSTGTTNQTQVLVK